MYNPTNILWKLCPVKKLTVNSNTPINISRNIFICICTDHLMVLKCACNYAVPGVIHIARESVQAKVMHGSATTLPTSKHMLRYF